VNAHAVAVQSAVEERGLATARQQAWIERARSVPQAPDAQAQVRLAQRAAGALRRCAPPELDEVRAHVAAHWIAVRLWFPDDLPRAAEAAFRAAELLRWCGDIDSAARELEWARQLPVASAFRVRAALELGHLERRRRRFERALDLYSAVANDPTASAHWRDEACIWAGKTHAALGRTGEAARWFTRVAEGQGDALDRVRAFDEWASSFVATGDIEAAMGVLARCRVALHERAQQLTSAGERMRLALQRMRCVNAVERAVAERRRSPILHASGDDDE
jgi:tetratricopeptide (TPR) repeat protein